MDIEVLKLVAQGGFAVALLALIAFIGRRMILAMDNTARATTGAIDKLAGKVEANTTATREAIGELCQDLAVLGARVEVWTNAPRDRSTGSGPVVDPFGPAAHARHGR